MADSDHPLGAAAADWRHLHDALITVRNGVVEHGRAVIPVLDGGFAYTVGLAGQDMPELMMFGPPVPIADMLDEMAVWCLQSRDNRVTVPAWQWKFTRDTGTHTLGVRLRDTSPIPDPATMFVTALYGADHPVLVLDLNACPCETCKHKVICDDDGKFIRDGE